MIIEPASAKASSIRSDEANGLGKAPKAVSEKVELFSSRYPGYFAWPAIGLYVVFIIAPSIAGIGYSFTDWSAYT